MESKKTVLSEKIIIENTLAKACIVDNPSIGRKIKTAYDNIKFEASNLFEDIPLEYDNQYDRIKDYIKESIYCYHNIALRPIAYFGSLHRPTEPSLTAVRNNVIEPANSADYTSLYMVSGEGTLFLHYDDNIRQRQCYYLPLKPKSIVTFNSTISYHLSRNSSDDDRTLLTFLYKLV